MKKETNSPISNEELDRFLKANPQIKQALDLFKISQEQYLKAFQPKEPQITVSDRIIVELTA